MITDKFILITNLCFCIWVGDGSSIPPTQPIEGIICLENNINIQVRENTGRNIIGQSSSSDGSSYSNKSIFQGQSVNQNSNVVS